MISGFIFFKASKSTVTVSFWFFSGVSPSAFSFGSSTATYSRRVLYSSSPSRYIRYVPIPMQIPKPSSIRHTATIPISFTCFIIPSISNFLHEKRTATEVTVQISYSSWFFFLVYQKIPAIPPTDKTRRKIGSQMLVSSPVFGDFT